MNANDVTAVDIFANGRRGRLFIRGIGATELEIRDAIRRYMDEDDGAREELLRPLLSSRLVRMIAHRTIGLPDVFQVFVRDVGEGTYACTIVSDDRMRADVREHGRVLEGFSLQVAQVMTIDGLRAAAEAWAMRNFPDLVPRAVFLDLWTDPSGFSTDLVRQMVSQRVGRLGRPTCDELVPDPSLAQPGYEDAA